MNRMTKSSHQQQPPSDDSSSWDRRPRAPIATATTHDYGTMSKSSNATNEKETSASQPLTTGEPPKAAIRRKIQQKAQQPLERLIMNETNTAAAANQLGASPAAPRSTSASDSSKQREKDEDQHREDETKQSSELDQRISNISNQVAQQRYGQHETTAPKPDANQHKRAYPKKVLFIVANEFCERFSYYGLRTVLVLYFRSVLGLSDAGSTVSFHLFTTLCYLTPILGAILGDSVLGKYKTILYLSIVYFFGELLLVVASVFWDLDWFSVVMTWGALLMIGIGTGGIKPCVSAFGGDQFEAHETKWRENFFSLFYGAINLGSLISMFLTPMLRAQYKCVGRSDCYPLAFLVPCILMFVAIVVFLLAHNHYYVAPLPERNMILAFGQCTWLALKRKLKGHRLPDSRNQLLSGQANETNSSNSSLSITSSATGGGVETETTPVVGASKQMMVAIIDRPKGEVIPLEHDGADSQTSDSARRRNHWLYLASDCFDSNSIEEFRCILGIFFLFLPTPMFWALFDQQGSLWTLQATRMDGRIWNTNFVLEPDQMMVFNPILLLASIPLFQLVIYPLLNKCNLLTTPIQKMTTGGFLAALTFVLSALIEFQIQATMPASEVQQNYANLLLVNGISDCSLIDPNLIAFNESTLIDSIGPLGSQRVAVSLQNPTQDAGSLLASPTQVYRLTFRLGTGTNQTSAPQPTPISSQFLSPNTTAHAVKLAVNATAPPVSVGCPFDLRQNNELLVGPLADRSMHMLYVEQGNGKLSYKLFNESLMLPAAGKARVRLLYESFGSYSQAMKRQFRLSKDSSTLKEQSRSHPELKFSMTTRDGQVFLSNYMDLEVASSGDTFTLKLGDLNGSGTSLEHPVKIFLKPGTRNLIVLHQKDAKSFELHQELLQDNNYRISVLYQLAPYMLISASEVLFSITGLEFSYSMAPPGMKSLILGAWCLTTALGNLLTVAVESIHFFDNIGYDFLLYAALMALDILVFGIIGYNYEPPFLSASKSSQATKLK